MRITDSKVSMERLLTITKPLAAPPQSLGFDRGRLGYRPSNGKRRGARSLSKLSRKH